MAKMYRLSNIVMGDKNIYVISKPIIKVIID